jgi:putative phosphoribosyl transferase
MAVEREVEVMAGEARLGGTLAVPEGAQGLVIFGGTLELETRP